MPLQLVVKLSEEELDLMIGLLTYAQEEDNLAYNQEDLNLMIQILEKLNIAGLKGTSS